MSRHSDDSRAPERVESGLRLFTLPNAVSILRMVLLVPVLVLLDRPGSGSQAAGVALLLVAGFTDLADGALARWRGWVSPSGKIVDPVADKVLIGGLVIYLAATRGFPVWLVGLVLIRDAALVLGATVILKRERLVFAANRSGKLTTFALGLLIMAYVLRLTAAYQPLTVAATAMLVISTVSYGRRALGAEQVDASPAEEEPSRD